MFVVVCGGRFTFRVPCHSNQCTKIICEGFYQTKHVKYNGQAKRPANEEELDKPRSEEYIIVPLYVREWIRFRQEMIWSHFTTKEAMNLYLGTAIIELSFYSFYFLIFFE